MKAKPSIMFDDLSGSAGNVTASRNNGGLSLHAKVTPKNPKTSYQTDIRESFKKRTQSWGETLTEAERNAWNEAAKTFTGKKSFGISAKLSGINAYVRVNSNLAIIGKNPVTTPPIAKEFPKIELYGIAKGEGEPFGATTGKGIGILIKSPIALVDMTTVVRMTPILPNGVSSKPSALRIITKSDKILSVNGSETHEIPGASGSKQFKGYSIPVGLEWEKRLNQKEYEGSVKVGVEIYIIDNNTGFSSGKIQGTFYTCEFTPTE